jgi:hypothetical protein
VQPWTFPFQPIRLNHPSSRCFKCGGIQICGGKNIRALLVIATCLLTSLSLMSNCSTLSTHRSRGRLNGVFSKFSSCISFQTILQLSWKHLVCSKLQLMTGVGAPADYIPSCPIREKLPNSNFGHYMFFLYLGFSP